MHDRLRAETASGQAARDPAGECNQSSRQPFLGLGWLGLAGLWACLLVAVGAFREADCAKPVGTSHGSGDLGSRSPGQRAIWQAWRGAVLEMPLPGALTSSSAEAPSPQPASPTTAEQRGPEKQERGAERAHAALVPGLEEALSLRKSPGLALRISFCRSMSIEGGLGDNATAPRWRPLAFSLAGVATQGAHPQRGVV